MYPAYNVGREVVSVEPEEPKTGMADRPLSMTPGLPSQLLIALLRGYQGWLSPLLGPACRFHPTCSRYASEAITKHGAPRGLWLALRRVGRCHPFHAGGLDPVP